MQDKSTFLLAADSEAEMDEWIGTLNKILHNSFEQAMQERRNGDLHDGVSALIFFFSLIGEFFCLYQSVHGCLRHLQVLQRPRLTHHYFLI